MDGWSALTALLLSPEGRAALTGGTPGQVVKLVRLTLGWTQQDLADRSGWSQSTISRIEDGTTRGARDLDVLADLARALGIPCAALYQAAEGDPGRTLNDMDRRDVLGRAVALAVAALLPQGVATAGRIDAAQAAQCWTALHRLFELDDQQAGEQTSPTLLSVLAAREAVGYARTGDRTAATGSIAQARAALAANDAGAYPRNQTLYTVGLGSVLTRVGQFDEAIAVTGDALQRVDAMRGCGRAVTQLHHTVDLLGRQNYPPARSFAAAARQLLPASA